ncbi:MAG: serine hydrolase, partial [Pseudomonadales bacterium]
MTKSFLAPVLAPALAIALLLFAPIGVGQTAAPIIPAPPSLSSGGYLLMDVATGTKLVEFNADEKLPPASLTKIMTSYIAAVELQRGTINEEDQVAISVKAWQMEGSRMFIQEGTKVGLMDLLRGVIIQSGNDASVAVAEHIAGGEDSFAALMNQHAEQLGMTSSSFVNATGLPDDSHYTTASDLALLTAALIRQFPEHYSIYAEKYFTYNDIRQSNRNRLLWEDDTVDGVKTGHTQAAGYCLVSSADRAGLRLVAVVMGAESEAARVQDSRKLLTYGFRFFETAQLYDAGEPVKKLRLWGGVENAISVGLP